VHLTTAIPAVRRGVSKRNGQMDRDYIISRWKSKREIGSPVKTGRFLWHITYRSTLEDFSIARDGLLCPDEGAVFAHDGLKRFMDMFPWILDFWDMRDYAVEGAQYNMYSFWRIDTRIAGLQWYRDPFMAEDADAYGVNPRMYVCTPNPVPPAALRLYEFDLDRYLKPLVRVWIEEGVAHIGGNRGDFEGLVLKTFR